MIDPAIVTALFAALGVSERPLKVRGGFASCELYVSESDVRRGKTVCRSVTCRKFGKTWTLSITMNDLTETTERADHGEIG